MSKYRVYGTMTASKFLGEFEADSEDDALVMALNSEANHVTLCHQCAGEIDLCENSFVDGQVEEIKP